MINDKIREKISKTIEKAKIIIKGQDDLLEAIIMALVSEGHVLIEGYPGLGKTLSVKVLSHLIDLSFKRIQFTPDVMPSDIIGTMIYSPAKSEFQVKYGPIFTQLLLADEINRAPPKVQSALLESMEERQVTIGEETYKLSSPFVVLATQNSIDHEGTYPLPEAQVDRFMMKVDVKYPDFNSEVEIIDLKKNNLLKIPQTLSIDDLIKIKRAIHNLYVDKKIKELIVKIVSATRPSSSHFIKKYKDIISVGASPRASYWLCELSKFKAFMEGKEFVTPDHLLSIIPKVIGHRLILSYEASMDNLKGSALAYQMANSIV